MKKALPIAALFVLALISLTSHLASGQDRLTRDDREIRLIPLGEKPAYQTLEETALSSLCEPGNVENSSSDPWSEECYLNDSCEEQGNPCQANDVTLLGAYIADEFGNAISTCDFGDPTTVYLWGRFQNGTNTARYAVRTRTEIWINGEFETELNSCSFDVLGPGATNQALIGAFTFSCGDLVEFRSTWIGWQTSAGRRMCGRG